MEQEVITSPTNKDIKLLRSLHERKYRKQTGWFLAEGMRICCEATSLGFAPMRLVYAAGRDEDEMIKDLIASCRQAGGRAMAVSPDLLSRISRKDNPQMVIGAFAQQWHKEDAITHDVNDLWIALDRVRDPGNLGTIIRLLWHKESHSLLLKCFKTLLRCMGLDTEAPGGMCKSGAGQTLPSMSESTSPF